ncbi:hypothetical protein G7051_07065 [Dysgonomonas sp. HDW5B]|uniref:hypothetical protein n=1 Tax=Dysgonomonas sp. HDW5B TaxID=2714927 RepID=UPI001408FD16|nr:hypothetical protein [Dysgonomonas sp. HDW5B]QIK54106.1 hypothetical protein G7051_07065 [Dysgonomonas sp. HDW5B]
MKLKHFLLGIALIGCCGLFLTSCEDEMDSGHTVGGKDPDSMNRSTQNEVNDTIFITTPIFEND